MRNLAAAAAGLALALSGAVVPALPAQATGPAVTGRWSPPFAEPTVAGRQTDEVCVDEPQPGDDHDGKRVTCKPAAGSLAVLGGDDVVYWNALEDTEEVEVSVAAEFGAVSINDQVRRLRVAAPGHDPSTSSWSVSTPNDGGGHPAGYANDPLLPPPLSSTEPYNDSALFCSSLTFLPDGRVMAAGGTAYYHDPAIASKYGVSELEGMRDSRIYDPATNSWSRAGDMTYGRWYPSLVPLADGDVFVASGVKRLIKTAYPDQAIEDGDVADAAADSGRNVVDTETFDTATGTWSENPDTADRSLPLFPRLHLLPNGAVYFNAAGQVFNPDGYAYDELFWNRTAFYDPAGKSWSDGGIPGIGTPAPGFRGSTFSVMLPLRPGANGTYGRASFLTAGGILGVSPGTYLAVKDSRIDTVDTTVSSGSGPAQVSTPTGPLARPRWYGTGVLAPTGEVFAFSGASADEVVGPGTAIPVTTPEVFTPDGNGGGTWAELAPAGERRTYHNTAALLPDGRILIGGHAPISTLYGNNTTLVDGTTSPQETRNPSFEIFEPPYLFRGDRPRIVDSPAATSIGATFDVVLAGSDAASDVDSVVLMRRTAITHLVDGGQRAVELPVVRRTGNVLTVRMPSQPAVLPPGPYLLFVNGKGDGRGAVPSIAADIAVTSTGDGAAPASDGHRRDPLVAHTASAPERPPVDLVAAGAVPVDAGIAFHEIAEVMDRPHVHRREHVQAHAHHPAALAASTTGGRSGGLPTLPVVVAVAALAFVSVAMVRRRPIGQRAVARMGAPRR